MLSPVTVKAFYNTVLSLNTPGYSSPAVEAEFGPRNLAFQALSSSWLLPSCIAWQVTSYICNKRGNCPVLCP